MVYHFAVMYPNEEGLQFNEDYYLQTHMPLVESVWGKYGLKSWKIIKYTISADGSPSPYTISAKLEWESADSLKAALQDPESPKVFADIANFTNVKPITLAGNEL